MIKFTRIVMQGLTESIEKDVETLTVPSVNNFKQDPKSARTMCPFLSSNTLSGFMSL